MATLKHQTNLETVQRVALKAEDFKMKLMFNKTITKNIEKLKLKL